MMRTATTHAQGLEWSNCDLEPIHIPGSIQPHGYLLVLKEPGLTVLQASANLDGLLGKGIGDALGRPLDDLIGPTEAGILREGLDRLLVGPAPSQIGTVTIRAGGRDCSYHVLAHRNEAGVILEIEESSSREPTVFPTLYPLVRTFLARMEEAETANELSRLAAEEVRRITGFDRVLVYRFDADWHGTVIAEDRNDELVSYFGLRFPASDIPAQARALYEANRLRLIADSEYRPVPIAPEISPATGRPLDLSFAALRSVSPVHVQYMKNMGTRASMSISILQDGRLWGLISCHHKRAKAVPIEVRTICDFLGQVLSMQLAAKERHEDIENRIRLKSIQSRLLASMAHEDDFIDGLMKQSDDLLAFADARGVAVVHDDRCELAGETPDTSQVQRIVDWLSERVRQEVFSTAVLAEMMPEAAAFRERACGLMAISISRVHRSHVLWFRPEVIQTVNWGGDPSKPTGPSDAEGRLQPRRSFEIWKETVRLRSLPWLPSEIDTAAELRHAIVEIVLKKAEELVQLGAELKRINRELEAFSYSVSHDLRAPFRHIVGYSELLLEEPGLGENARRFAGTIIESAQYAGTLVDNLLEFSKMGRAALRPVPVQMGRLFQEVRREVMAAESDPDRTIRWRIGDLPDAVCDPTMMKLAVRNLLSNAVKYTRGRAEAEIEVRGEVHPKELVYSIRDNGIGFDMKYVEKLFGVFERLHRMEDFEGTGIGLANVRRIIERHGGRARAEGVVGQGATFVFTLPMAPKPDEGGPC